MATAITQAPQNRVREYETIYILRSDVDPDAAEKLAARVADVVGKQNGRLVKVENWGRRRLAFPISKQHRGVYTFVKYLGGGSLVAELERNLRLQDVVIRYQTVQIRDNVIADDVQINPEELAFARLEPAGEDEKEESRERLLGLVDLPDERRPRREGEGEGFDGEEESMNPDLAEAEGEEKLHDPAQRRFRRRQGPRPHARPQRRRPRAPPHEPQARLQVLRGQDPGHRLQGPAGPAVLHQRARQDRPAAHLGQLRAPPAQGPARHQARAQHRAHALHHHGRLRGFVMAAYVQVVLQESLKNLGTHGELVRVRPGYARNFLVPRGHAVYATEKNVARIEHEKREAVARAAKQKAEATGLAGKLAGVTVTVSRQVGEGDRMYGSVTPKDVHAALEAAGHKVDRRKIELPEIKGLGTYEASVRLAPEVSASFKVEVVKQLERFRRSRSTPGKTLEADVVGPIGADPASSREPRRVTPSEAHVHLGPCGKLVNNLGETWGCGACGKPGAISCSSREFQAFALGTERWSRRPSRGCRPKCGPRFGDRSAGAPRRAEINPAGSHPARPRLPRAGLSNVGRSSARRPQVERTTGEGRAPRRRRVAGMLLFFCSGA